MPPDPPEYQPEENQYPDVWMRVYLSGHSTCGAWSISEDGAPACVCGTAMPANAKAAA
jgi:hypothetical protein